jgi:S-adenosyl methyltransferase
MPMGQAGTPGREPGQPAAARVYDYLLGGKDNYPVDRAVGRKR